MDRKIISGVIGLLLSGLCLSAYATDASLNANHSLISSLEVSSGTESVYEITITNQSNENLNNLHLVLMDDQGIQLFEGTEDISISSLAVDEKIVLNWTSLSVMQRGWLEPLKFYVTGTDGLGTPVSFEVSSQSNVTQE